MAETRPVLSLHTGKLHPDATGGGMSSNSSSASRGGIESERRVLFLPPCAANFQCLEDGCLEVAYRMYWLCYHIHTYKKTQVALVNGTSMGGGAALMVLMKFSVVTEKTVFATPKASVGFHTDCGFSYLHSHLPGYLGEYLALTGARLNGKELVVAKWATHFVPSEVDVTQIIENHSAYVGKTKQILEQLELESYYPGITALTIDKDNAPKWDPTSLDKLSDEDVDLVQM
ncbi:hypothetical protein Dimus_020153, partial [Dionaea muscipula]